MRFELLRQRVERAAAGKCGVDGAAGFVGAAERHIGQLVAAGRVEHGQLATGVGIHPLAGNQVPGAQQFCIL